MHQKTSLDLLTYSSVWIIGSLLHFDLSQEEGRKKKETENKKYVLFSLTYISSSHKQETARKWNTSHTSVCVFAYSRERKSFPMIYCHASCFCPRVSSTSSKSFFFLVSISIFFARVENLSRNATKNSQNAARETQRRTAKKTWCPWESDSVHFVKSLFLLVTALTWWIRKHSMDWDFSPY